MHHRTDQAAIDAEAAAWLARLQGHWPDDNTELALQAWLNHDPRHREAFGRACEIWDLLPGAVGNAVWHETQAHASAVPMSVPVPAGTPSSPHANGRFARPALVMAAAFAILLLLSPIAALRDPRYETATGETRVVRLDDGSRITLNTNSLVAVDYAAKERQVRLLRGEALFEVSKDPSRPFIVAHKGGQVRALGTTFVVRDEPQQMSVTLIEGRVEVTRDAPDTQNGTARVAILSPGERITLTPKAGAVVDHPPLNIVTAWRKGEIMFDDTRLIDAAAEYNRYIRGTEIVVDPSVASLRLSGVFATRDPLQFSETVAALHNIQARQRGNEIHLSR